MKSKKLFSFILAAAMTLSLLPTFTITAGATTTEKNITLGTAALSGDNKYVYYGRYEYVYGYTRYNKPIEWRILSTNGNSGTYADVDGNTVASSNAMFLLSEYALKQVTYEDAGNWLNNTDDDTSFISSSFTDSEKAYLLKTSKDNIWTETYTDELKDDTFFFLSEYEATKLIGNHRQLLGATILTSGDDVGWWLRDSYNGNRAFFVDADGWINRLGFVWNDDYTARPAFNLNLSSVLFTSAASGGKSSTADAGRGLEISKNTDYIPNGWGEYEYKLTMLDSGREFAVTESSVNGDKGEKITLNYENAETGSNEYISAMIVNDDDEVLYYGQLENVADSDDKSGTFDFKIPSDIDYGTYKLKLFNEQINGDYKTDYSSAFAPLELKVFPKATFDTVPNVNMTYNGSEQKLLTVGASSEGTVKYSLSENGPYSTDIPSAKNVGTYTVWYYIEGDSNHVDSDKTSITITIAPKDIGDATITLGNSLTYNGTSQTQTISSVTVAGLELTENIDYTVSNNTAKFPADNYELTVTGIGNFTGTATKRFTVARADSQTTATADSSVTYGDTLTLTATVAQSARLMNRVDFYVGEGDDAALLGTAREIIDGTATLEVDTTQKKLKIGDNKITADYSGSIVLNGSKSNMITVTLNPKEVGLSWSGYATRDYDGQSSNVTATATGTLGNDEIGVTVAGGNETNAGNHTATATALTGADAGYYKLPTAVTQDYTISPKSIENATLAIDGELTYNGNEQTQNVTLNLDGFTNVTFDISDNKQTDVKTEGNYTLTVTGTGNFKGTKTLDWNIKPYTPTENPDKKTTAKVRKNRTLAEATVTNGEMLGVDGVTALEGTFAWVDDTKTVSADGTEQMTFTPTDANYAPITVDVAVSTYSSSGGGSSASGTYTVTFETDGGNTITSQKIKKSGVATEPTTPTKEGYIFDGWYTDKNCTTAYDFDTKVTKNITLYAKWVEDEMQEPTDDKKDDEPQTDDWSNPFADVKETDWFFDSVKYANENGLMSGMTSDTFAPNENITRGMFATVLWRAEGEPAVDFAMPFTDVIDTAYYTEALRWAASENIVNGVTATEFAPDDNITREQIAVILYRYAKFKGYDVSVGEDTNILSYADFDEISEYAISAVQYAVGSGLMKGKTERTFHPKDFATRAEIAAILSRFIEANK